MLNAPTLLLSPFSISSFNLDRFACAPLSQTMPLSPGPSSSPPLFSPFSSGSKAAQLSLACPIRYSSFSFTTEMLFANCRLILVPSFASSVMMNPIACLSVWLSIPPCIVHIVVHGKLLFKSQDYRSNRPSFNT